MSGHGVAVVGLGLALAPHASALRDLAARLPVIGAYSRSEARRAAAAERHGLPVTDDLDALIADPRVRLGLVLTPPATHLEVAERFLAAGKHVLVEKPLAADLSAAAALVERARATGRTLGVMLQHRFRPAAMALADRLAAGSLGRIEAASCRVPWWRPQSYYDEPGRGTRARDGGGVLMTQAIHTLDLYRSLIGSVHEVTALARTTAVHRMECEDAVAALLTLQGGAIASFDATTAAVPGHREEIRLVCTRGTATLAGQTLTIDRVDGRREEIEGGAGTGAGADPMAFDHGPHREVMADVLDAIEQGREPRTSGAEALRTQRLIETLLQAAATRSWLPFDGR